MNKPKIKIVIYKVEYDWHVYIGQTCNLLKDRKNAHKVSAFTNNSQFHFHRALRKYGWDVWTWEVIEEHDNKIDADNAEKYWIKYYREHLFYKCMNQTDGGEGCIGREVSDEVRKRISLKQKGKKKNLSPEQIEYARSIRIGKKRSEKTKEKMRLSHLGKKYKPMSQNGKDNLSKAHKGYIIPESQRKAMSESMKKTWAKKKLQQNDTTK